jgi:hypothetical protein
VQAKHADSWTEVTLGEPSGCGTVVFRRGMCFGWESGVAARVGLVAARLETVHRKRPTAFYEVEAYDE